MLGYSSDKTNKIAVLLSTVLCEERDEIRGNQSPGCMVGDQTLPIEYAIGVSSLLQLYLSRRREMSGDNNIKAISWWIG